MATAKRSSSGPSRFGGRAWPRVLLALVVLGGTLAWVYRAPIDGYTTVGTAFGARTACSCRYVAGRGLEDCEKDFEPGMELVFLSDDPENRSVTARVPLIASDTARYREGFGCILDPWDG
jgi:hypothetical protein